MGGGGMVRERNRECNRQSYHRDSGHWSGSPCHWLLARSSLVS